MNGVSIAINSISRTLIVTGIDMSHTVRRVLPHEYSKYCTHLKALDDASRYLRFGFAIKDEMIDRLCAGFEQEPSKHILFCVENNELEFIAVGHVALGDTTELAFSVLKEHQGTGIGNLLMKRCIRYCRTHNIYSGYMMCLSQNTAIKRLCTKNHIQVHSAHGETEADIEFAKPSLITFMKEGLAMHNGALDYALKRASLPWTSMSKSIDNMLK